MDDTDLKMQELCEMLRAKSLEAFAANRHQICGLFVDPNLNLNEHRELIKHLAMFAVNESDGYAVKLEKKDSRVFHEEDEIRNEHLGKTDWRHQLVFDSNVSENSPVFHGTWITVSQIVSLIVDGWTWSDILRFHPELSEDDIRTALAYSVEHEDNAHA